MERFACDFSLATRNLSVEAGDLQHQRPHTRSGKCRIEGRQQLSTFDPLAFLNVD